MERTHIRVEVSEAVATVTLDRPDRLNAFTPTMARELIEAMDEFDADDGVRAVVFTGAGRGFCAGADLAAGGETFAGAGDDAARPSVPRDLGGLVTLRFFESTKPLIAAVNGPAVGVGVTMTLPMDIRLASTEARFGFVFARRGIVPEAASSWFLPRLVGISQALRWCLSGRVFDAGEALAGGLVSELCEPGDLVDRAHELAGEIATTTSATSVALTRQMLWRMLGAGHPMRAHEVDTAGVAALGRSGDAREGVESFLEKRQPAFADRVSADLPAWFPWWDDEEYRPLA